MQVNVELFASLRDGCFKTGMAELKDNSRVYDVIEKYHLPFEEVAVCHVNGHNAGDNQVLKNGDTVTLFPPIGGA